MEGGGGESIVTCVCFFVCMLRVESASLANLNHYLLQSSQ